MNIDLLIKMTNEIGDFFKGAEVNDSKAAAQDVANHLRRYWDPRMRGQERRASGERQAAGLTDRARNAVGLLSAASKAPATPPGAASAPPGSVSSPGGQGAAAPSAAAPAAAPAKGAGT